MKQIDIEKWARKSHYNWFSKFANPTVALDFKLDVTNLLKYCETRKLSSFSILMYAVCKCVNRNEAMRLRIKNEKVYLIDAANVAYTIMVNDHDFVNCRARTCLGLKVFLQDVEDNRQRYCNSNYIQEEYNDTSVVDDVYCSCLPWLSFLSVAQPIPDNDNSSKSIPRLCWCKYYEENKRVYTTFNITINHALVDGIDLALVCNDIQQTINNLDKCLEDK